MPRPISGCVGDFTGQCKEPLGPARRFDLEMADTAQRDGHQSALLFGTERDGLSNDDLARVDVLVQIPANPSFSSLNLAQAVNLMGSDVYRAFQEVGTTEVGSDGGAAGGGAVDAAADGTDPAGSGGAALFNHRKDPPSTKEEQRAISERAKSSLDHATSGLSHTCCCCCR